MRRNVRRLNREVGGVLPTTGGTKGKRAAASPAGEDDEEEEQPKNRGSGGKKAANLQELKRYYAAAEEAAQEILLEGTDIRDVEGLAHIDHSLPLTSPSRYMQYTMARNNPLFVEKLKRKLQESGVTFEMPTDMARSTARGSRQGRAKPKPARKGAKRKGSSAYYDDNIYAANSKMRGKRRGGGSPDDYDEEYDDEYSYSPDLLGIGMGMSDDSGDRRSGRIRTQRSSLRGANALIGLGDDQDDSIISRRHRKQLQITINGGNHDMGPPENVSPRSRALQLSHESPFHGDPLAGGLSSLGSLMGLPIGDTPHGAQGLLTSMTGLDSRKCHGSPRFDFDEVADNFPSPRMADGILGGASPSRWTTGSASSLGSKIFQFPDSTRPGSSSAQHGFPPSGGSAPLTDLKQSAHAKKFKRVHQGAEGLMGSSPMSALSTPMLTALRAETPLNQFMTSDVGENSMGDKGDEESVSRT